MTDRLWRCPYGLPRLIARFVTNCTNRITRFCILHFLPVISSGCFKVAVPKKGAKIADSAQFPLLLGIGFRQSLVAIRQQIASQLVPG